MPRVFCDFLSFNQYADETQLYISIKLPQSFVKTTCIWNRTVTKCYPMFTKLLSATWQSDRRINICYLLSTPPTLPPKLKCLQQSIISASVMFILKWCICAVAVLDGGWMGASIKAGCLHIIGEYCLFQWSVFQREVRYSLWEKLNSTWSSSIQRHRRFWGHIMRPVVTFMQKWSHYLTQTLEITRFNSPFNNPLDSTERHDHWRRWD